MTSHFLTGLELNKAQALKLLSLAQTIKQQPKEFNQALAGQSIVPCLKSRAYVLVCLLILVLIV